MPHISVKCRPGLAGEEKRKLAEALVKIANSVFEVGEDAFSVTIEEIPVEDWKEKVYIPEIIGRKEILYKKPGYTLD